MFQQVLNFITSCKKESKKYFWLGALALWLWKETRVQEFVSSNPINGY